MLKKLLFTLVLLAMTFAVPIRLTQARHIKPYQVRVWPVLECGHTTVGFTYSFDTRLEALQFARRVAHEGVERKISGSTPGAQTTLALYPTIRKIRVWRVRTN